MSGKKQVLIIGAGGIGKRHIRGYLKTGRAALSVVELRAERLEEVMEAYDIQEGYERLENANLSTFDLAVICAPANLHVPLSKQCAEAGVSFMVEKPLSVDMGGVDDLLTTVEENGVVARVGYVRRSSNELMEMRKQIENGRIGETRMCYMNASQEYPKYRPDYRDIYYAHEDMGGGAILDCASHFIDILLWFFGTPAEVSAMYDRLELEGVECEDSCLISIRFENGQMAQININQFQKPNVSTIDMVGTEGNLLLDHAELKFADDDSGNWETTDFQEGMTPMEIHEGRFRFQADMMMDAAEGKPDHLTTLQEAKVNLQVALAAKESYRTKQIVEL
ncbi:MAG: Gfo/Idh/MocA family oxidoreductase [Planctomycetes bacterium]|nr:Gfo/Idh/MocA family oxidoreductase [Planctomycetota bacterium]